MREEPVPTAGAPDVLRNPIPEPDPQPPQPDPTPEPGASSARTGTGTSICNRPEWTKYIGGQPI